MPIGEIGAFLLFLVIVFIVGNLWFHFVEAILRQINGQWRDCPWPAQRKIGFTL